MLIEKQGPRNIIDNSKADKNILYRVKGVQVSLQQMYLINVQCYSHYSRLCNSFISFHSCNTFSSQNLICEIIARQFVHLKKTTCASILIFERQQLTRVEFFPQNRLFFWKTETLYATLLNVPNYSFKN